MRHIDLTHKNPDGIIDHADDSISPSRIQHPFTFDEYPFTPPEAPTLPTHFANRKYVTDQADLARTHYVGIVPHYHHLAVTWTWTRWLLLPYLPPEARFVEILHVNPHITDGILIGSRNYWSVHNRWAPLGPRKQVTWTVHYEPHNWIDIYTNPTHADFYLVGYWT